MNLYSTDYRLEAEVEHGVSINPISFLVVQQDKVKLLPVNHTSCVDKILDYIPEVIDKVEGMINSKDENSQDNIEASNKKDNRIEEMRSNQPKKAKLNKIPKTSTENMEKAQKRKIKEDEAMQELEDIFEDEYEYEDE